MISITWRNDEAESPEYVRPPAQRKVSVIICGCITWHGVGTVTHVEEIVTGISIYMDILENNFRLVIARHLPDQNVLFQDDNVPKHRYRDVGNYKARNDINSISWPTHSADLNIIENMWLKLKRQLQCWAENIRNDKTLFLTYGSWLFMQLMQLFIVEDLFF